MNRRSNLVPDSGISPGILPRADASPFRRRGRDTSSARSAGGPVVPGAAGQIKPSRNGTLAWLPLQNGLLFEAPHRHRVTRFRTS